jgi:hypothetical protein
MPILVSFFVSVVVPVVALGAQAVRAITIASSAEITFSGTKDLDVDIDTLLIEFSNMDQDQRTNLL